MMTNDDLVKMRKKMMVVTSKVWSRYMLREIAQED